MEHRRQKNETKAEDGYNWIKEDGGKSSETVDRPTKESGSWFKEAAKKDAIASKVRERDEAEGLFEKKLNEIKLKVMILNLKYGLPAEAAAASTTQPTGQMSQSVINELETRFINLEQ